MKPKKRIVSLLLAICLMAGMLPCISITASATDTGKAIQLGTGGIKSPTATSTNSGTYQEPNSYVYFGVNGTTPIKWRVLDADKANDGSTAGMFLLSEYLLGSGVSFDADGSANSGQFFPNEYQYSDAQTWCKNFASNSSNFSTAEQNAMLGVAKTDSAESSLYSIEWSASSLTMDDKMYSLSVRELADYVGNYDRAPGLAATFVDNSTGGWWLRSPDEEDKYFAGAVDGGGFVNGNYVNYDWAARPVFNLNLNFILFTSVASGSKSAIGMNSGLTAVSSYSGREWKLTLLDSSRNSFAAEFVKTSTSTFIAYTDAQTGSNEYISDYH